MRYVITHDQLYKSRLHCVALHYNALYRITLCSRLIPCAMFLLLGDLCACCLFMVFVCSLKHTSTVSGVTSTSNCLNVGQRGHAIHMCEFGLRMSDQLGGKFQTTLVQFGSISSNNLPYVVEIKPHLVIPRIRAAIVPERFLTNVPYTRGATKKQCTMHGASAAVRGKNVRVAHVLPEIWASLVRGWGSREPGA